MKRRWTGSGASSTSKGRLQKIGVRKELRGVFGWVISREREKRQVALFVG